MTSILFLACMLMVGCAHGDDRDVLSTIPTAAANAVRARAGAVTITRVSRETGDRYEASWYVDGKRHEATVSAAGALLAYEVEVDEAQVPIAVRDTVHRALGRGARYERQLDGSYEAERVIDNRETEIRVAPDGRLLEREEAAADDDDDDDGSDDD